VCPLIEVQDLHYRYEDGTPALTGVDFLLKPGESVALLGPNGSGKTTFALHLNGLLRGEGRIRICGLTLEKQSLPAIRRKIGMVFQDSDSQLFMPTVLEDVTFGLLNLGMDSSSALAKARATLEAVGMSAAEDRAPYHLSAGEKKRVALAGVLAMEPEILVLDEPTTYLDPPAHRALAELLVQLHQSKILITHDSHLAAVICNRAVFFERGQVAGEGSVDSMVARFGWDLTWERSKSRS